VHPRGCVYVFVCACRDIRCRREHVGAQRHSTLATQSQHPDAIPRRVVLEPRRAAKDEWGQVGSATWVDYRLDCPRGNLKIKNVLLRGLSVMAAGLTGHPLNGRREGCRGDEEGQSGRPEPCREHRPKQV
jgi:hypothetical protein